MGSVAVSADEPVNCAYAWWDMLEFRDRDVLEALAEERVLLALPLIESYGDLVKHRSRLIDLVQYAHDLLHPEIEEGCRALGVNLRETQISLERRLSTALVNRLISKMEVPYGPSSTCTLHRHSYP